MMRPIFIFILILIQFSCAKKHQENTNAKLLNWNLLTKKDTFIAGESITLNFEVESKAKYRLILSYIRRK